MFKLLIILILFCQAIAVPIVNETEKQMPPFNLTSEYFMIGKTSGTIIQPIVPYENSFCFITRSKCLQNNERCRVTYNYIVGDDKLWWTIEFISDNSNYECGARCITMNN